MQSKKDMIYELFFAYPTKEWHFEEIVRSAKIARSKADHWLKELIKEGIIKRVKEKGAQPYCIARISSPEYRNKKKLFALEKLYASGFLNHISSLEKVQTAILFGSFVRSDWYKNSDIDIFIYGDPEGLRLAPYELKLHRDIQVFICQNPEEVEKFGKGFIQNVLKGYLLKGNHAPLLEKYYA